MLTAAAFLTIVPAVETAPIWDSSSSFIAAHRAEGLLVLRAPRGVVALRERRERRDIAQVVSVRLPVGLHRAPVLSGRRRTRSLRQRGKAPGQDDCRQCRDCPSHRLSFWFRFRRTAPAEHGEGESRGGTRRVKEDREGVVARMAAW